MELNENHKPSSRRETLLTVMLTFLCGGAFLAFMIFVTGGFFFYVFLAVAAITAVGYLHYLWWGHGMMNEVAEEQAHDAAVERFRREQETPSTAVWRHRRM